MAQQLEAQTALAEDRSLISGNHKKQNTTTYNSSLAELDTHSLMASRGDGGRRIRRSKSASATK